MRLIYSVIVVAVIVMTNCIAMESIAVVGEKMKHSQRYEHLQVQKICDRFHELENRVSFEQKDIEELDNYMSSLKKALTETKEEIYATSECHSPALLECDTISALTSEISDLLERARKQTSVQK